MDEDGYVNWLLEQEIIEENEELLQLSKALDKIEFEIERDYGINPSDLRFNRTISEKMPEHMDIDEDVWNEWLDTFHEYNRKLYKEKKRRNLV